MHRFLVLSRSAPRSFARALAGTALLFVSGLATGCADRAVGADPAEEQEQRQLMSSGCRSQVCLRAGAAGCWTQSMESSCKSCEDQYGKTNALAVWTGCAPQLSAYSACLRTAEFACVDAGVAGPVTCLAERDVVESCLDRARDGGGE